MKPVLVLAALILLPILGSAEPIPEGTKVPMEIRKALAKATIIKLITTVSPDRHEVDREKVCEVQGEISVYDLRGNTVGFQMPKFEEFSECSSVLNGAAVTVQVGAQLYDGWSAVQLKGPGKFFFGRIGVIGSTPAGMYQWVEAGTTDPNTKSIVGSAHLNTQLNTNGPKNRSRLISKSWTLNRNAFLFILVLNGHVSYAAAFKTVYFVFKVSTQAI